MSTYDFKAGKTRIDEILNGRVIVTEQNEIPESSLFTFENGYYGWASSIFVDIRNSHVLFKKSDKVIISKVIRCFTSEIIEILRASANLREIGIRGDCVYAIYTTPSKEEIFSIAEKTFEINTYMNALNQSLASVRYPEIKVGIGMSTARDLVVKAGREESDISSLVWIGEAVTTASKISSLANKRGYGKVVFSELSYTNILPFYTSEYPEAANWFTQKNSTFGKLYCVDLIIKKFQEWIDEGMPV